MYNYRLRRLTNKFFMKHEMICLISICFFIWAGLIILEGTWYGAKLSGVVYSVWWNDRGAIYTKLAHARLAREVHQLLNCSSPTHGFLAKRAITLLRTSLIWVRDESNLSHDQSPFTATQPRFTVLQRQVTYRGAAHDRQGLLADQFYVRRTLHDGAHLAQGQTVIARLWLRLVHLQTSGCMDQAITNHPSNITMIAEMECTKTAKIKCLRIQANPRVYSATNRYLLHSSRSNSGK